MPVDLPARTMRDTAARSTSPERPLPGAGRRKALACAAVLAAVGSLWPDSPVIIPVQGATPRDWNARSFWHEPWGASGVHKGIDVFAPKGRPVVAAVPGVVVYAGELGRGGRVVAVLGPRWRVHYYAHLDELHATVFSWTERGGALGTVGTSGNAAGKAPHLHYSVVSLLPLPWRFSTATQGWKQMFFLDPDALLRRQ